MSITRSTRVVNVGRLKPVADPFRARQNSVDPDECGPPCPQCGSLETFWYTDRRTTGPVLICHACIDSVTEAPDVEEPRHG